MTHLYLRQWKSYYLLVSCIYKNCCMLFITGHSFKRSPIITSISQLVCCTFFLECFFLSCPGSQIGVVSVFDLRVLGECKTMPLLSYSAHRRAVNRLAFSPRDSKLLASVSDDCGVYLRQVDSNATVWVIFRLFVVLVCGGARETCRCQGILERHVCEPGTLWDIVLAYEDDVITVKVMLGSGGWSPGVMGYRGVGERCFSRERTTDRLPDLDLVPNGLWGGLC